MVEKQRPSRDISRWQQFKELDELERRLCSTKVAYKKFKKSLDSPPMGDSIMIITTKVNKCWNL